MNSEIQDNALLLKDDNSDRAEGSGLSDLFVAEGASNRFYNVGSVMNVAPYVVLESSPLSRVYSLFTNMGLRHLVVLGGQQGFDVVGIITRSNLREDNLDRARARQR